MNPIKFILQMVRLALIGTIICMLVFCKRKEVVEPDQLLVVFTVTNASTYGGKEGKVIANVSGGEQPYKFFWSNGTTDQNLINVGAGVYELKVIYGEGGKGVSTKKVVITEPEPSYKLKFNIDTIALSRYSKSDGGLSATISNGVEPYTYLWKSENWDVKNYPVTSEIKDIPSGKYTLVVQDNNSYKPVIDSIVIDFKDPMFVCVSDSARDEEGNVYPTALIGNQCWTAKNLRVKNVPSTNNSIEEYYCKGVFCTISAPEGPQYSWKAVMNSAQGLPTTEGSTEVKGICPEGWHIPTLKEIDTLAINAQVVDLRKGGKSGFEAYNTGIFGYTSVSDAAYFWTSTVSTDISKAYSAKLGTVNFLFREQAIIQSGMSLRCVKNRNTFIKP